MAPPRTDGQIQVYRDPSVRYETPRILYVNGIQTTGETHELTALVLSQITQRPVIGVYNRTAGHGTAKGFFFDLLQCGGDWINGFSSQVGEFGFDAVNSAIDHVRKWMGRPSASNPADVGRKLREKIPRDRLVRFIERYLAATNDASASLFSELNRYMGSRQLIVAHSQGNLITASALWALQTVHGEGGLGNLQVYSVASPAPAWPAGINFRIKVYGHTNDPVTLADPKNLLGRRSAGDWREFEGGGFKGIDPHDIAVNFFGTNMVSRIRSDLGLGPFADTSGQEQTYKPGDRVHVVNRGDTLSALSTRYYGAPNRWQEIYNRNQGVIGADPNRLQPGMKIVIPA